MTADQIIEGILGKEGGYVNNPNDKGGPTRWGITQTTARAYGYSGDMKALPRIQPKQFICRNTGLNRSSTASPSCRQPLHRNCVIPA
jgi:lysozyme family protein